MAKKWTGRRLVLPMLAPLSKMEEFFQKAKQYAQDCISYFSVGTFLDFCTEIFNNSFQHPCC
jgi:hypothetical protein